MAEITLPQSPGLTTANSTSTGVSSVVPTISPAVVTSKQATDDVNNIKTQHADIVSGMNNQATTNANTKAQADVAASTKATADAAAKATADKLAIDKQAADAKTAAVTGTTPTTIPTVGQSVYNPATGAMTTVYNIGKNGDGSYSVTYADTPNTQRVEAADIGKLTSATGKEEGIQSALAKAQADYQAQAKNVQDTITNIQNGTIPLNAGQIAQIDGLKQQFQQLIDQQDLANTNASGMGNIRGYQTGAAEYDPSFQAKTIGSIVTAGLNKVSDLNIKMSSAVAKLTEAFQSDNIKAVKDAWDIYQDASKARSDALQKTIDDTQKAIKDARDAKDKLEKDAYDRTTKPINDVLEDAAKNGASQAILDKIRASKSPDEAIANAGDWLQTGSGTVGEWLAYKREEEKSGRTPMGLNAYSTLDANRKMSLAKAGKETVGEKKSNAYGAINQLIGLKNSEGMPYLDAMGYFTAKGFKDIVTNAVEDGISRKDIIDQYGSYISPYNPSGYGLTPAEIKSLGIKE